MGTTTYNDPVESAKNWEALEDAVNTEDTAKSETETEVATDETNG